jgi:hypothetical protein
LRSVWSALDEFAELPYGYERKMLPDGLRADAAMLMTLASLHYDHRFVVFEPTTADGFS